MLESYVNYFTDKLMDLILKEEMVMNAAGICV